MAYRVVQEALTNARKHAPGSPVELVMAGGPGEELRIDVSNPAPAAAGPVPGSGLGLAGVAERVELAGGRLAHGTAAGRFRRLTTFHADAYVLRALRAGASGYLLKDAPPRELIEAVRRVAAGEPILSPAVTRRLIEQVADPVSHDRREAARALLGRTTDREREVASAVARGLSNAQIGAELGMGVPTVKAHVSRLLTKLGLDNRVQLALLVHDAG
ncbi:LuxR C-terminal-related transcriptional regulator [Actinoplanes sp. NPDC051513]|uniref:LuxR C-terminal-related transcriptional regulator n=1 Tax=Actinoplanes sp. NPDC051513 TaxID=3363908 RepID=UPI003787EE10